MKRVLITGVSRGIGKYLTFEFLKKGYFVSGVGKTKPDFEKDSFEFFENNFENFKEIDFNTNFDIVVLNSGITIYKKMKDVSESELYKVFKVNLFGNLLTLQSALKKGKVKLVSFISSIATLEQNNFENWGLYSSSKIAMEKILKIFAKEVGFKLLIFNIGRVDTDIWKSVSGKEKSLPKLSPETVAENIVKNIEEGLKDKSLSYKHIVIE